MRLLLPRRRRGAGLSRLSVRPRRSGAPPALLLLISLASLAGCGGGRAHARAHEGPEPAAEARPAFGITEDNANLLWSPEAHGPAAASAFMSSREALTALHPRYVRLLVDWARLQPSPAAPPELSASVDGCARGTGPCGTYEGLAGELAAIASQQRAARAAGRSGFEVVIDILGVPAWAALPPHGCEAAGTPSAARPIAASALSSYRALIAALVALGRREGVALPWWSPWNEPNDPRFLSPQRGSCGGAPAAPAVYAQLAEAMSNELGADDPSARILLGELGGYEDGSSHRLSIAQFVDALPAQVLCLAHTWALHVYAARLPGAAGQDPVGALEAALDTRGGCASGAEIWITESGAGAREPGRARSELPGEAGAACEALATQLLAWRRDPRVAAVFQYEFRDDPAYPVGLASADLRSLDPDYGLWLALREPVAPAAVSTPQSLCSP